MHQLLKLIHFDMLDHSPKKYFPKITCPKEEKILKFEFSKSALTREYKEINKIIECNLVNIMVSSV